MDMSFKEFLNEFDASDENMTPADFARYQKQKKLNPKMAAMKMAKQQELQAKAAKVDDSQSPEQKQAEELEARAARKRARAAQQQKSEDEAY